MSSDSALHSARERLRLIFGPDYARNRARFAMYHEMFAISRRTPLVRPTPADVDAFALAHPVSSSEMLRMERVAAAAVTCGAAGGVAAGAVAWRHNRMVAYAGIGALLGAMSASFLADNAASWVFGTYTFDQLETKATFVDFMRERYPDAPTVGTDNE